MPSYSSHPAIRSHMETQVNFVTEMARHTYDAVRRLSEIHLQLAQQLFDDTTNASHQLMSSADPVQFSAAAFNQWQPVAEHLRDYQQQVMGVLAGISVNLTRAAETHIPDASRSAAAAAEEMARRTADLTQAYTRQRPGDRTPSQAHGTNGAGHTPG